MYRRLPYVLMLCSALAVAQPSLMTDQRIYDLFKAGLHTDELVRMILTAPEVSFELSPGSLDVLRQAGISDDVIKAMAARVNWNPGRRRTISLPTYGDVTPPAFPDEIGVYTLEDNRWVEVMPEVVNWQTGGVLKQIATIGIVKGDVNGRLRGPTSPTRLATPVQLLVDCPEGVVISEYQLIRMHTHSDSREFRTITGGVFHVSSGAKRDTFDFESSRVAKRSYLVDLPALDRGEYGLLPPGMSMSNSPSALLGKMYTFSVR